MTVDLRDNTTAIPIMTKEDASTGKWSGKQIMLPLDASGVQIRNAVQELYGVGEDVFTGMMAVTFNHIKEKMDRARRRFGA